MTDREDESIAIQIAARLNTVFDHRCSDCGDKIINPGAHAERCYGPVAHGRCECPPGWRHERGCPESSWPEDAA